MCWAKNFTKWINTMRYHNFDEILNWSIVFYLHILFSASLLRNHQKRFARFSNLNLRNYFHVIVLDLTRVLSYFKNLCTGLPKIVENVITSTTTIIISYLILILIEAVVWRCSVKKVFLEISQNSQENTCARVSFFYYKRDSVTGAFLWILRSF